MALKQILTILATVLALGVSAQFYDDFLDNGTELDTAWQGTRDKFYIKEIDATTNQLVLNDTAASSTRNYAYLSRPSQAILAAEWQISLTFADLELTNYNYARFYVVADTTTLDGALNGYFVWIGNSGKEVALYRQNGTKTTKIIDGSDGRTAGCTGIDLKLTRDSAGTWQLYSRLEGESEFTLEGDCSDRTNLNARYTGLLFCYSKTNGRDKYLCNSISAAGNPYIKPEQTVRKYDIVFSEIMADPEPQNQLPLHEFLEIYNRTDTAIDLAGWTLTINNKWATIAEGTLQPHSYAILCAENAAAEFKSYGQTVVAAPWQLIPNSGAVVQLFDAQKNLVAWVDFTDKWYGNAAFKKDGGWSLERIDGDYLDNHAENWKPSEDASGGTPGQPNSVATELPDERAPRLEYIAATSDTVTLCFSKTMDEATLADKSNYRLSLGIDTIIIAQPHANVAQLKLHNKLTASELETFVIENLFCVDSLPLGTVECEIALPVPPEVGDIVLNEILFNPKDDGVDFVELWNISDKTLDLGQLLVTRRRNGELDSRTAICNEPRLVAPHAYLVLTSDRDKVCAQYDCPDDGHFATVKLPSLNDDEGNIIIVLNDGTVIDEMSYTEKMHHAFVSNPEGVSLERVNPHAPTQQADNWQSASFEVGYATPARQNSQYLESGNDEEKQNFWLEYETFTPDNDGFRDLLPINYRLPHDGFTATITIYNPTGTRMRRLLGGELTGTEGTIYWNGRNDSDALCGVGVYVIFVEAVRPDGAKIRQKIVCVLSM